MYGTHHIIRLALLISAPCMTVLCYSQEPNSPALPKQPWVTPIAPTPLSTIDGMPLPLTAAWGYTPIEEYSGVTETLIDLPPAVSNEHSSAPCNNPACMTASSSSQTCPTPATNKKACAKFFDLQKHYRHPSTFRPHGDAVNSTFSIQVQNGQAARTVLYQYDFFRANASLNQRGYLELLEIAERVSQTPYPLVIQMSGDAALDAARRETVIEHLARLPFEIPDERVVIDIPRVAGLDGIDAVLAHEGLLQLSAYGSGGTSGGSSSVAPFALPTGQ